MAKARAQAWMRCFPHIGDGKLRMMPEVEYDMRVVSGEWL